MKSNLLSKTQTSLILKEISQAWQITAPKIKNLKMYQIESNEQILVGGDFKILYINKQYIPFLGDTALLAKFPTVTVDMGAIKFMCNGANVMRPGIKTHTKFDSGQIVCVCEESQQKFLAVGVSLVSSTDMDDMVKGEVIKNIHYISDKFWELAKSFGITTS